MAKVKLQKKSKSSNSPKHTFKIKKPNIKLGKLKFKKLKVSKPDFKNMFSNKVFKTLLIVFGAIVIFILVDLFVQYLNNGYSVAVVNGTRISMNKYHKRLESSYGATIAKQLIDEQLINLEAKKADVTVSDEEIDERLNSIIESVGGEEAYAQALLANNITEAQLIDQIKLDELARKIIEPTLEYTEDDIKAFFEQYSSVIFPNESAALEEGEKLDYELYKDGVKDIFIQQEVENAKYTWLESLTGEYKIQDNSTSKPKYGVLSATINIVKNLLNETNSNTEVETETTE